MRVRFQHALVFALSPRPHRPGPRVRPAVMDGASRRASEGCVRGAARPVPVPVPVPMTVGGTSCDGGSQQSEAQTERPGPALLYTTLSSDAAICTSRDGRVRWHGGQDRKTPRTASGVRRRGNERVGGEGKASDATANDDNAPPSLWKP